MSLPSTQLLNKWQLTLKKSFNATPMDSNGFCYYDENRSILLLKNIASFASFQTTPLTYSISREMSVFLLK